jgi:two-component system sensor histidine kinase/response regulator
MIRDAAGSAAVILVVDDQADNVRVVGQLLAHAGFDVVPATSGHEGLNLAQGDPPDLVLLDMRMPGLNGFQVLNALQENVATRDVPVIFLTGDVERESLTRAFGAGAVDYITKPFMPDELLLRVRTHIELKQSRDALRRIASEKQSLAETVAHDLRNYFTNILFAADMLREPGASEESRLRLIDSICASGDAGVLFLQALLDQQSAQAQAGAVEQLDASELMMQAVDLLKRQASAKSIRIAVEAEASLTLLGHRAGTLHVLQNLLSNALKYSPVRSDILLTARSVDQRGQICVHDRGPGISEADRSRLFQRYVSLSARPTQGESSTGLGLALAKQRARSMGGDVRYADREGGGSVFTLDLPLA